MNGTFVPIPSDDLVVFVKDDSDPHTVVGWVVAIEDHEDGCMLHTMRPVYIDDGFPTDHSHDYTVVRRDDLDRV